MSLAYNRVVLWHIMTNSSLIWPQKTLAFWLLQVRAQRVGPVHVSQEHDDGEPWLNDTIMIPYSMIHHVYTYYIYLSYLILSYLINLSLYLDLDLYLSIHLCVCYIYIWPTVPSACSICSIAPLTPRISPWFQCHPTALASSRARRAISSGPADEGKSHRKSMGKTRVSCRFPHRLKFFGFFDPLPCRQLETCTFAQETVCCIL